MEEVDNMLESISDLERRSEFIGKRFNRSATLNEINARKREYHRRFLEADAVYCSPFTRAIETACVGLQGHPAVEKRGITLCRFVVFIVYPLLSVFIGVLYMRSVMREFKGVGGLDSVGVAHGPAIIDRLYTELEAKVGKARADKVCHSSILILKKSLFLTHSLVLHHRFLSEGSWIRVCSST